MAVENGYMVYTPPLSRRIMRKLGFREPAPQLLTQEQLEAGYNEEVFTRTTITISLADRIRILLTGTAKLFIITSAKVRIPEAVVSVSFTVATGMSDD